MIAPDARRTARAVIAHHSKSFALASRLLGRSARDRAAVVYAWCRRADDAIDERGAATRDELAGALAGLAGDVDAVYRGAATEPVLAGFAEVVRSRAIPRSYPGELLAGLAMDATGVRYAAIDDVIGYAWRVAGVVGLMMCHVFGVAGDHALVPAAHLGIAMQLTNICRDVAEDWQRGRLYLPDDLLAAHGAGGLAGELGGALPASARPAIARARAELLALADRYYRSGDRGLAALPWRAALAGAAARRS
jgi:phytoene synthase